MSSSPTRQAEVLVWVVVPQDGSRSRLESRNKWLEKVDGWLRVLQGDARQPKLLRVVALCSKEIIKDAAGQRLVESGLKGLKAVSCQHLSRIEFQDIEGGVSCSRQSSDDTARLSECDHLVKTRCARVHHLLLVDQDGNGFPCYGIWRAYGSQQIDLPDQTILRAAYIGGRFRSLCVECAHGQIDAKWRLFPCSRHGCRAKPTIWGDKAGYAHLQFSGEGARQWCEHYEPIFEVSLEQSRTMLERLLFEGDYWRDAFLRDKKALDTFWAGSRKAPSNVMPIYGAYAFAEDTPTSLEVHPPSNFFLQYPHELEDKDRLEQLREQFLPICFLPHLRVLFELVPDAHLLSVVLTDPFSRTEFSYRSLYRDGEKAPECFSDDLWKKIWRLPNTWGDWKHVVLNLSSAVRRKKRTQSAIVDEPEEYMVVLKGGLSTPTTFGKREIDLSKLYQDSLATIKARAERLRALVASTGTMPFSSGEGSGEPAEPSKAVFLYPERPADGQIGRRAWSIEADNPFRGHFYLSGPGDRWVECFADDTSDVVKEKWGCGILNYLIWIKAVFGDSLSAIETFNSTNLSRSKPSQFVVYSSAPLDAVARARFKLTLATLLQPIEETYAIYSEMLKSEAQRNKDLAEGAYRIGHPLAQHAGRLRDTIITIEDYLREKRDMACVDTQVRLGRRYASRTVALGHMLDLISRAISEPTTGDRIFLVKREWHESTRPYDVVSALKRVLVEVNQGEGDEGKGHRICVPDADWKCFGNIAIALWIKNGDLSARPADFFYDEIFTEIVTNAFRCGRQAEGQVPLRLAVENLCVPEVGRGYSKCLVFANVAQKEVDVRPFGIAANKWEQWNLSSSGGVGGLFFVANCLEKTRAGRLFARVEKTCSGDIFKIGLCLEGLKVGP
jgi:hypothetical protein